MYKYLLLFLLSTPVYASNYHHHHEPTNTGNAAPSNTGNGIALSLATAQQHFDFGTHSWQGSIGAGTFDSDAAISFGVAKRLDRVLVNGSVGFESGKTGVGIGVNWRF